MGANITKSVLVSWNESSNELSINSPSFYINCINCIITYYTVNTIMYILKIFLFIKKDLYQIDISLFIYFIPKNLLAFSLVASQTVS